MQQPWLVVEITVFSKIYKLGDIEILCKLKKRYEIRNRIVETRRIALSMSTLTKILICWIGELLSFTNHSTWI